MAVGANNNKLKAASEKMAVMVAVATAMAAGTNNNQLKVVVEKTAIVAVVVALLLCNGDSCKDNDDGNNNGDDKGSSRSGGAGSSGDGGGNGCGSALGNLPSVNNVTIVLMTFPTIPMTLTPPQWPRRDKRRRHVRRGRGWATTQCHLPLAAAMAATN
jgi:hypothetical protein